MLSVAEDPVLGFVLLFLALFLSMVALWKLGVPLRDSHRLLSERWLYGVPWGTLIVVSGLFVVYLFVQRGWWDWHRPVVVAYTSVSMFDPIGWFFAGFSHTTPSHLRGNVTSTLVFGPLVEWIWRHKPDSRLEGDEPAWRYDPRIRAFVLFPLGVALLAIVATLFSWGPVIGFSVAAYALVGIALVHYPVLTLVGLVARQSLRVLWQTWDDPFVFTETTIRAVRPSWYGTAVQGHLVGLLLGVAIGLVLLRRYGHRTNLGRLWLASVFVGFYLSLWALWWVAGPEQYMLYRAIGVALVFAVATLIAVSAAVPRPESTRLPSLLPSAAAGILVISLVGMGVVGVGLNFATAEPPDRPVAVSVGDYEISYGENVPDGMVNLVELEAIGLTSHVRTSGVIVYSERRNVWRQPISKADLEARGSARFTVGGLGWDEQIRVQRGGWLPTGAQPVYQVWIADEAAWHHAYASEPGVARVRIADRRFAIVPDDGDFLLAVEWNGDIEWVEIPGRGTNVTAHGIVVTRVEDRLVASNDGTEVTIATRERYDE